MEIPRNHNGHVGFFCIFEKLYMLIHDLNLQI